MSENTISGSLDICNAYGKREHGPVLEGLLDIEICSSTITLRAKQSKGPFSFLNAPDSSAEKSSFIRDVPQDGVLNPTLFNVATLSVKGVLPKTVRSTIYADYTCLWSSSVRHNVARASSEAPFMPTLAG